VISAVVSSKYFDRTKKETTTRPTVLESISNFADYCSNLWQLLSFIAILQQYTQVTSSMPAGKDCTVLIKKNMTT
jgi:hypothetical protein